MDHFKVALRSLLSTPGPTLVVVVTLALAIGANTAVFSVVSGVLLRPLGYGADDRLVVPWATTPAAGDFRLSPADYRDLRDEADTLAGRVALYRYIGSTLTGLDQPVRVGSMTVTPRLFDVLGVTPALGRFFTDEDEPTGGGREVVITHASWARRFGSDPSIVGSTIELDGGPATVVAVTRPGFLFPPDNAAVEVYFPMRLTDQILLDRNHRMFDGIARLGDGATIEAARAEIGAIAERLAREFPDTNDGWGMTLRPLREELLGDVGATLRVLAGAVFLVLLVACANVANVLIARSTATAREYAVRAALGARARDLRRRSLAESLLLGAAGGGLGLVVAIGGTSLLRTVVPAGIPRGDAIGVDMTVLAFAAALSIAATFLFGSLSALRASAPDLLALLKPAGASPGAAGGGRRVREAMVVVEVALAIVLLVGAGLMVRSFVRLSEVDPGFRRAGVVSVAVQLPGSRYARSEWRPFFERLTQRAQELPGIERAGAVSDLPMSSVGLGLELEFSVPGLVALSPTARPNADVRMVLPGYFDVMSMEVVHGRDLDTLDTTAGRFLAVVNQTLVDRYFSELDPVGRSITVDTLGPVEIVGVVNDIRHGGLQSRFESEIYLPFGRLATAEMHLVVRSELDAGAVAARIGSLLGELDDRLAPSQVVAISDLLHESIAQPRFNTALLGALALCAAFLAVVGTYGIVAFAVSRRANEIGVRMALGADSASTVRMIVRRALGIVIVGALLGLAGALGASRVLVGLLFGVPPTDPATYATVLAGAIVVGALAAWLPARRAARVDPVESLRTE